MNAKALFANRWALVLAALAVVAFGSERALAGRGHGHGRGRGAGAPRLRAGSCDRPARPSHVVAPFRCRPSVRRVIALRRRPAVIIVRPRPLRRRPMVIRPPLLRRHTLFARHGRRGWRRPCRPCRPCRPHRRGGINLSFTVRIGH
jgi:hypothetical protein